MPAARASLITLADRQNAFLKEKKSIVRVTIIIVMLEKSNWFVAAGGQVPVSYYHNNTFPFIT